MLETVARSPVLRSTLPVAAVLTAALLLAPAAEAQCSASGCMAGSGGMTCTGTFMGPGCATGMCSLGMFGSITMSTNVTTCMVTGMPIDMVFAMHMAGSSSAATCVARRGTICGTLTVGLGCTSARVTTPAITCALSQATPGGGLPVELMEFSVEGDEESADAVESGDHEVDTDG